MGISSVIAIAWQWSYHSVQSQLFFSFLRKVLVCSFYSSTWYPIICRDFLDDNRCLHSSRLFIRPNVILSFNIKIVFSAIVRYKKALNLINNNKPKPVKMTHIHIQHCTLSKPSETSNYSYLGSTVSIFEYKYPLPASVIVSTSHSYRVRIRI